MQNEKPTHEYRTLAEIRLRKDRLSDEIEQHSEKIATLWGMLFAKQENSTKGEHMATLIANGVTAVDTFLLVRKLMKNYGGIFKFLKSKKTK